MRKNIMDIEKIAHANDQLVSTSELRQNEKISQSLENRVLSFAFGSSEDDVLVSASNVECEHLPDDHSGELDSGYVQSDGFKYNMDGYPLLRFPSHNRLILLVKCHSSCFS